MSTGIIWLRIQACGMVFFTEDEPLSFINVWALLDQQIYCTHTSLEGRISMEFLILLKMHKTFQFKNQKRSDHFV
jgi:hypothetical protein